MRLTEGDSGIGQALCEELARAGAGGICRRYESAQKVAASLPSLKRHINHLGN